jgi:hypothetical protein
MPSEQSSHEASKSNPVSDVRVVPIDGEQFEKLIEQSRALFGKRQLVVFDEVGNWGGRIQAQQLEYAIQLPGSDRGGSLHRKEGFGFDQDP